MYRGSRSYLSLLTGSHTSQVMDSVGTPQAGSRTAVDMSGRSSMSLSSMCVNPLMEEPSKPTPSASMSSSSRWDG